MCLRVKCKRNDRGCDWIGQLRHAEVWSSVLVFQFLIHPLPFQVASLSRVFRPSSANSFPSSPLAFFSPSSCPCICLSVCLSVNVCLSICVCLSVCLSVYVCLYVYLCMSVCMSICVCLSVCLSVNVCLSVYLCMSVCMSICLSVGLSICLSACLSDSVRQSIS